MSKSSVKRNLFPTKKPMPSNNNLASNSMYDEEYDDAPINQGLLNRERKSIRDSTLSAYYAPTDKFSRREWTRPYWLGTSLLLLLFAFWLLDSLKEPLFARLVEGNIETHQPTAKLCSVATTLVLVCGMEYLANWRQQQTLQHQEETPNDDILDPGGIWKSMVMYPLERRQQKKHTGHSPDDTISISIFYQIGIPYAIAFSIIAACVVQFEAAEDTIEPGFDAWYILAYVLFATVESFGSISVATFWSFANSTLSLDHAERYYGTIVALAQLGAIGGSTLVASENWKNPALLVVVSLVIILQLLVMRVYDRRFLPTSLLATAAATTTLSATPPQDDADDHHSIITWQDNDATATKPFWSGLYLIFQNYYVMLILGVSSLYEIALTCLDYQMKLLGYAKFDTTAQMGVGNGSGGGEEMSFTEFMGRYGQVVNIASLIGSSLIFPKLIRRYGLRITLRLFPTLLLAITVIAYGALPGNLAVLFVSLSLLKAMTYSIHDPAKELLYIPTSNAVKFRAKVWIDVVGERISKAAGSALNRASGSVQQSIKIGGLPSLLSAAGLWFTCYYAGLEFDRLLRTGTIVGLEDTLDPATYTQVPRREDKKGDDSDGEAAAASDNPSEVEIYFGEESSVSTLGGDLNLSLHISDDDNTDDDPLLGGLVKPVIVRI